jgi:hypothetical protein
MLGGSSICWEMTYLISMSFSIGWLHATKSMSADGYCDLYKLLYCTKFFIMNIFVSISVENGRLSLAEELSQLPRLYW